MPVTPVLWGTETRGSLALATISLTLGPGRDSVSREQGRSDKQGTLCPHMVSECPQTWAHVYIHHGQKDGRQHTHTQINQNAI